MLQVLLLSLVSFVRVPLSKCVCRVNICVSWEENTDVCKEFAHPSLERRNAVIFDSLNIPLFLFSLAVSLSVCFSRCVGKQSMMHQGWRFQKVEVISCQSFLFIFLFPEFLTNDSRADSLPSSAVIFVQKKRFKQYLHLKRATHQFTVVTSDSR